jgi:hypothetical protein
MDIITKNTGASSEDRYILGICMRQYVKRYEGRVYKDLLGSLRLNLTIL